MKALSLIYSFLLTICLVGLTMWQVAIESPTFVVFMFFAMAFLSFATLCKCLEEFYAGK